MHTHAHTSPPHTVTREEVEHLLYAYRGITGDPNGRIDRIKFRDLLHDHFYMSDDFFMDRVFRAFDKDSDSFLSHDEWVLGMSIFLRGNLEQKTECEFLSVLELCDWTWEMEWFEQSIVIEFCIPNKSPGHTIITELSIPKKSPGQSIITELSIPKKSPGQSIIIELSLPIESLTL